MKNKVLALAGVAEISTGLLLFAWPPMVVRLLFGAEISGVGVIMSRISGVALISLGVSCWPGSSAFQPLNGMLTYSTLAMFYLGYIGIRSEMAGLFLWPAVVVHGILGVFLFRARFKEKTPAV